MELSKSKQLKSGAILSYSQMFLGVIIGLLYTPVMIRLLGDSEYGLYNTVSSTISMLSVLSLGFNSSYIRYYAKYKKDNDDVSIYKLNGLFLIVFFIIGLIALVCGLFLTEHLNLVFNDGLTQEEYSIARVLMLLLTLNLAVSFPMSVFSNIISAHEKFIFLKALGILKTVVSPLVTIPLLLMGYKSIAMVSVTVGIAIFTDILYLIYVIGKLKQKFIFHSFEKGLFKSLFAYTAFIAINLIVDQINSNVDKLLLTRYKGTTVVAIYSAGYTIETYYQMFSTSISGVFTPRIHLIYNNRDIDEQTRNKKLTELFIKVGRIQFCILALIASGFVFFGKSFIHYWAGPGYTDAYFVALLLMIPITVPLIQNLGIEIQRAANKHQFRSFVYLGMAILNLVLTIFMCQKYGAVGAAVGTAISLLLANGLVMNIYYQKKLKINIILFWKNIARMSIALIIPIVFGIALVLLVDITSVWGLLVAIIAYALVYCASMWFIGLNDYEKGLILKPIKKIFKKV